MSSYNPTPINNNISPEFESVVQTMGEKIHDTWAHRELYMDGLMVLLVMMN